MKTTGSSVYLHLWNRYLPITKIIQMLANLKVREMKLSLSYKVVFQIYQSLAQPLTGVFQFLGIQIRLFMFGLMRCLTMQQRLD
jgi:hypothetical protein